MKKIFLILFTLLLSGCSVTKNKFNIKDLQEIAPISYSSIDKINGITAKNEGIYSVIIDDLQCYFIEEDDLSVLVTYEDDFEKILPFFFSKEEIEKIITDYENWILEKNVISTYYYEKFDIGFTYDSNNARYITISPAKGLVK